MLPGTSPITSRRPPLENATTITTWNPLPKFHVAVHRTRCLSGSRGRLSMPWHSLPCSHCSLPIASHAAISDGWFRGLTPVPTLQKSFSFLARFTMCGNDGNTGRDSNLVRVKDDSGKTCPLRRPLASPYTLSVYQCQSPLCRPIITFTIPS